MTTKEHSKQLHETVIERYKLGDGDKKHLQVTEHLSAHCLGIKTWGYCRSSPFPATAGIIRMG